MHVKNEVFYNHPGIWRNVGPFNHVLSIIISTIHAAKNAALNSVAAVNHINYEAQYPVKEVTVYQLKALTLLK